jgi:tetratricopeptide (TPR) repeat protein
MSELLRVVVQADLEELYWIQPTRSEAWVESVYRDVIFAFQTSDLRALEGLLSELDAAPMDHRASAEFLKKLTDVRLAIRKRALLPEILEALESTKATSEIWEGERAFVLAMAHENRSELPQARDRYLRASELLTKARVHRKALKALMNHVAIESWIDPDDKRLIADFSQVLGRALRLRDRAIAGIAILNISWEWERLGALEVALRYARHAVRFLERDFGSLNFHHGLVHRAHLYYRMGRLPEMEADLTLAESSKSAEIQSALRFLRTLANEKPTRILLEEFQKDPQLTPAWQERLSWQLNPEKLSGDRLLSSLESKLISLVSLKPRTSRELLSQLYSGEVGAESARQRLDQLLLRLRKKVPGIILLREGHYHLHDVPPVLMDTEIDAKAA